jgi:hypothetical protein
MIYINTYCIMLWGECKDTKDKKELWIIDKEQNSAHLHNSAAEESSPHTPISCCSTTVNTITTLTVLLRRVNRKWLAKMSNRVRRTSCEEEIMIFSQPDSFPNL